MAALGAGPGPWATPGVGAGLPRSSAMAPALGLGVLLGLLGLLGHIGGVTKVLHSLRYLRVSVSEPSPGIPQFMETGFVDGIPFERYDSKRDRMEPLTQWMKDRAEPEYWDRNTRRAEKWQQEAADNLETLRDRYNQSRGLHTLQWLYGCDLLSNGSIRGSYRVGYDGRDFLSFDLGSGKFVAADGAAEITRRRWEQDGTMTKVWTNYLKHECPERLQKYVGYGQKELERKEPPDVHVSGKAENGTLILSCHAYGFYPKTIKVNWTKGDEIWDQETEWGGVVPNSDGTFHTWARIKALPEEREQYRCRVEHPGMPEPGIFAWEPTSGGNLPVVVAVSVIAAIPILTVLIGFIVWNLQSGRRDRDGYNVAAGKDVGTNGSTAECPWSVPRLCPAEMDPRKDLEGVVAVVAILGELVVTVTEPRRDEWPPLYPEYLHTALWKVALDLRDTLDHIAVTSLRQALATLKATQRPTWADVTTAERAWRESVDILWKSWRQVYADALEILKILKDEDTAEANNEDPAKTTTTGLAGDLWDKTPPGRGTAGDSLGATAPQRSVALPLAMATLDGPVTAATEAREGAVVATRQAGMATRRGQRVKESRELLRRFLEACDGGTPFPWDLNSWLESFEDSEEWTEASPDDPEAAVAKAKQLCGAEWLWEASACLTRDHLLGTLGEILKLLNDDGGSGGPGGPCGRAIAEQCQRAIEDIPRLLGGQ